MLEITIWWWIYIYNHVKLQLTFLESAITVLVSSIELNAIDPGFVIIVTSLGN